MKLKVPQQLIHLTDVFLTKYVAATCRKNVHPSLLHHSQDFMSKCLFDLTSDEPSVDRGLTVQAECSSTWPPDLSKDLTVEHLEGQKFPRFECEQRETSRSIPPSFFLPLILGCKLAKLPSSQASNSLVLHSF